MTLETARAPVVSIATYYADPLYARIACAVNAIFAKSNIVAPVDVFPAPWGLQVSYEPSNGQRRRQSPQGQGSRIKQSARRPCHVKVAIPCQLGCEYGLPTGCFAVVDNTPLDEMGVRRVVHNQARWTTLHRGMLTASTNARVVQ